MEKIRDVQQLEVWNKSHGVVLDVYKMTKVFPQHELYGIVSQMRRAAVSIPANISEGFKRFGKKDKIRFYNISQASCEELRYYLQLSKDLGYIEDNVEIMERVRSVIMMLSALIRSMK